MLLGLLVEVAKLDVPVRVLPALDRLGVALQREPLGAQQLGDRVGSGPMSLPGSDWRSR